MAAIAEPAPGPISTTAPPRAERLEDRILDAAIACVAVQGVRATTVDDIARAAGCGRATVYRTFPGGRSDLIQRAGLRQIQRFAASAEADLAATHDLEQLLVAGITGAARFFEEHGSLRHLVEHEPEIVATQVGFDRIDAVFATVAAFAVPHLARFLPAARAEEAAEWATRLVVSYLFVPSPGVDLTDDADARRLVQSHLLPGLVPDLSSPTEPIDPIDITVATLNEEPHP
jgi:AcrR family transcriptional regulator